MNRNLFALVLAVSCLGLTVRSAPLIDLTYPLNSQVPVYDVIYRPFSIIRDERHGIGYNESFRFRDFTMGEHTGTHLDAPQHFNPNGRTIDQVPLDRLIGPAVVINVKDKVDAGDVDYEVSLADVQDWEKRNGDVPEGSIVLFYSGWGERWPDRNRVLGTENSNSTEFHWPGWSGEACSYLVKRGAFIVGGDTMSADPGQTTTAACHVVTARNNVLIVENVANLEKVPESGARIQAMPIKIDGGTGAPSRLYAVIRSNNNS